MSRPRRWGRRVMLSVLAGGGLGAAGLGAPSVGVAGASDGHPEASPTKGRKPLPEVTSTDTTSQGQETGSAEETTSTTTTTTTTTTAATGTESTTTSTSSAAPAPSSSAPEPSTAAPSETPVVEQPPVIALQRRQLSTASGSRGRERSQESETASATSGAGKQTGNEPANVASNVALPPQLVAAQSEALAALLGNSQVSAQALSFYRIPLFLLPVYQAAAIQYGVPWQILAAINEVETDYGNDLSLSTAGAVGWMQFMPSTWLQYGVDVDGAGYADPYNPVDAIFAAARYLRAAGASHDLQSAIFAYNHSQAYVESVILRAKLIADYPSSVLATLTGLAEGVLPVTGAHVIGDSFAPGVSLMPGTSLPSPSSAAGSSDATANATSLPGSVPAPAPAASAARVERKASKTPQQLVDLTGAKGAAVIAVQDGRVVGLGRSHRLGRYLMLQDVYGDLFTYAGLGSIAPSYRNSPQAGTRVPRAALAGLASADDPAPTKAASAGAHPPLTLQVKTPTKSSAGTGRDGMAGTGRYATAPSGGKVRLFADPDNPYARAAMARAKQGNGTTHGNLPLRIGAVVSQGTILGHLASNPGSPLAELRFAVRPANDLETIDPRPVIESWRDLDSALHPRGAKDEAGLLGATAADVFLLSKDELARAVLADPGISLEGCARQDVESGAVDKRVLAALAFLSRSGLKPTVGELSCGSQDGVDDSARTPTRAPDTIEILSVNGVAIAGHQGPGSVTDLTIRTLLTLPSKFAPSRIVSLMDYPGSPSTLASRERWDSIELAFAPAGPPVPLNVAATARAAHSVGAGPTAPAPEVLSGDITPAQWSALIDRIGSLPNPTISRKPSDAAIRDPQAAPSNRDLGMNPLP